MRFEDIIEKQITRINKSGMRYLMRNISEWKSGIKGIV